MTYIVIGIITLKLYPKIPEVQNLKNIVDITKIVAAFKGKPTIYFKSGASQVGKMHFWG